MKTAFMDWLGCAVLRVLAGPVRAMPARPALAFGASLGSLAFWFSPRRRFAYADLKAAFVGRYSSRERWHIVREHYRQIGRSAVEMIRFPLIGRKTIERDIRIHHLERFLAVAEQKKGAMLLTAHLGNWELIQIVAGVLGYPIRALMRQQKHRRLNGLLNELRRIRGSEISATGMGVRELLRALRRGELVGILGDQSAGKDEGMIVPFFGRKTTVPTGAFELAAKTGAPVLPAFIVRENGEKHAIYIEEPICCPAGPKGPEAFREPVLRYLRIVEQWISRYPDQWLWAKKRWKYSWTKRLVILSDGKPGHFKQSEAVAEAFQSLKEQYGRPGMEYPLEHIPVRFRSSWHRKLFFVLGLFYIPWAQGRLSWLKLFLEPESAALLENTAADFVISAGAALVPLNLCLARENMAKSIVLMRPPFPYFFCRYGLAVVPAHDNGPFPRGKILRTLLTPSSASSDETMTRARQLREEVPEPEKIGVSVFLGGPAKSCPMPVHFVKRLITAVEEIAPRAGDYWITTSRRTPADVCAFLKSHGQRSRACQKIIFASEDKRPGIPEAMMRLAGTVIVTADSISMISEAAGSGKRVIVVKPENPGRLPRKHRRFIERLEKENAVESVRVEDLARLARKTAFSPAASLAEKERTELKSALREIL